MSVHSNFACIIEWHGIQNIQRILSNEWVSKFATINQRTNHIKDIENWFIFGICFRFDAINFRPLCKCERNLSLWVENVLLFSSCSECEHVPVEKWLFLYRFIMLHRLKYDSRELNNCIFGIIQCMASECSKWLCIWSFNVVTRTVYLPMKHYK